MKKFFQSAVFKISWRVFIFLTLLASIYTAVGLFKTYRLIKFYEQRLKNPPSLISPSARLAEVVSLSNNPFLYPGEIKKIKVSFRNLSRMVWQREGESPLHLGSFNPIVGADRQSLFVEGWLSINRPAKMSQETVGPGEIADFEFFIRAPNDIVAGRYRESFGLVLERKEWLINRGGRVDWDLYVKPTLFPAIDFVQESPEFSKINEEFKFYRPPLIGSALLVLVNVLIYQIITGWVLRRPLRVWGPFIALFHILLTALFILMALIIFFLKDPLVWGNIIRHLGFYAYGLILLMVFLSVLDWFLIRGTVPERALPRRENGKKSK